MCGIAGLVHTRSAQVPALAASLGAMNALQRHRGPDGRGTWMHPRACAGFGHVRLSIIDIAGGGQPMRTRRATGSPTTARSTTTSSCGTNCRTRRFRTASRHRGAPARLPALGRGLRSTICAGCSPSRSGTSRGTSCFCARDRFGIKPFYYTQIGDVLYFASEAKALLPFLPDVETDLEGLKDYLAFQFCLAGKTLFKGVRELLPGHYAARLARHRRHAARYWEVYYDLDFDHTAAVLRGAAPRRWSRNRCGCTCASDVPIGGVPQRRAGLRRRRVAGRRSTARTTDRLHRPFRRRSRLRREPLCPGRRRDRGFAARDVDDRRRRFRREHRATSSTTSTTRSPGPGSFPQYMVSRAVARQRARSCSAARAATRSSAATRAT